MTMKVTVMIHEADEGGYWAEVPALPGCFTQGQTLDEVRERVREAIATHLDVPLPDPIPAGAKVQEVEV
jgi:predicted RNase H-like HicB family nuclease